MKREQKRLQRKKAQYERSRREPRPPPVRLFSEMPYPPREPKGSPADSGLLGMISNYMKSMGVPLPMLKLDQLEVIKDAEIAQPDRLEHKGEP